MDLKKLREPFAEHDIEWRVGRSGVAQRGVWASLFAYVTNRAIQNRLDEIVGPQNWRNEFTPGPDGGVLCGLSIRIGEEWVTKWDGATNTDVEAVKGGLSDAMKRAAVQWGIGRYLYNLDETYAVVSETRTPGSRFGEAKQGQDKVRFWWSPPRLPKWALPGGSGDPDREAPQAVAESVVQPAEPAKPKSNGVPKAVKIETTVDADQLRSEFDEAIKADKEGRLTIEQVFALETHINAAGLANVLTKDQWAKSIHGARRMMAKLIAGKDLDQVGKFAKTLPKYATQGLLTEQQVEELMVIASAE